MSPQRRIKQLVSDLRPLNYVDYLLYGILLVFCFFAFQHGDILHTAQSSITYLQGHVRTFYDYNNARGFLDNYLPATYLLFALWNLPVYLLKLVTDVSQNPGMLVFWYKLLPTLFMGASAVVMYHIGLVMGLKKNAKLMSAFWLSSPILFFSQLIFGQYDIFTVFFVLLGLLSFLKKDMPKFVLFFAISLTFKYFSFFLFLPLLLLVEKRVPKIISYVCMAALPVALQIAFYLGSGGFKEGVFGFAATDRVFAAGIRVGLGVQINLFTVAFLLICLWSYYFKPKNPRALLETAVYQCLLISSLIFSLMVWNPQWVLFVTPFLALTTFVHPKARFFVLSELALMYAYIGVTVNAFKINVDQELWKLGIFGKLGWYYSSDRAMNAFFLPQDLDQLFSLFAFLLLLHPLLKFPSTKLGEWGTWLTTHELPILKSWDAVRWRFVAGVLIFVVPAAFILIENWAEMQ